MCHCNKCIYLTKVQLGVGCCCWETLKRWGMYEEPLYLWLNFADLKLLYKNSLVFKNSL